MPIEQTNLKNMENSFMEQEELSEDIGKKLFEEKFDGIKQEIWKSAMVKI